MVENRIYLDNCCYNRPYDDQTQIRISLETTAKIHIQSKVVDKEYELVTSYMTAYENSQNPYESHRNAISAYQEQNATLYVSEKLDSVVYELATHIESAGIKHKDACHIACAILSECEYFITTDDGILKYKTDKIKITDPVGFIREKEG